MGDGEAGESFGYNRIRAGALAVVLALFTVLVLFVLGGAEEVTAGSLFILAIMVALLVLGAANLQARLRWQGPVLSVGAEGICDRRIGPKTIPWAAMRQVYVYHYRRAAYLAVIVDDPHGYVDPPGPYERFALWANNALRLPQFSLSLSGLDASVKTILIAVGRHLPDHIDTEPPKRRRWI